MAQAKKDKKLYHLNSVNPRTWHHPLSAVQAASPEKPHFS